MFILILFFTVGLMNIHCAMSDQDSKERVKLKRGASEHDRLVTAMGADVLKRTRDALVANPSFVLYADDMKIIDMDLFENIDQVFWSCLCLFV